MCSQVRIADLTGRIRVGEEGREVLTPTNYYEVGCISHTALLHSLSSRFSGSLPGVTRVGEEGREDIETTNINNKQPITFYQLIS